MHAIWECTGVHDVLVLICDGSLLAIAALLIM